MFDALHIVIVCAPCLATQIEPTYGIVLFYVGLLRWVWPVIEIKWNLTGFSGPSRLLVRELATDSSLSRFCLGFESWVLFFGGGGRGGNRQLLTFFAGARRIFDPVGQ